MASSGGKSYGKGYANMYCSKESYFESSLRQEDAKGYSAAGVLLYRKGEQGLEVLLALERPWNSQAKDYDPLAWNPLGSKKTGSSTYQATNTASKSLLEVVGGMPDAPNGKLIETMCRSSPVVWYPNGRFALFVHEYTAEDGEVFANAPSLFPEVKEKGLYPYGAQEEGWTNSRGEVTTRWVKQIDELEWVPASDLLAESPRKPLTDLMRNLCFIGGFRQFLEGGDTPPPPSPQSKGKDGFDKGGKGGKYGKDGGGKKGGSKGKFNKGDNGCGGGFGKGMMPMPPPPMAPMAQNPQMYPIEMQRQMLGEKLYMLVQPMVPSQVIAQKVTGMLLELPMPELMPLLGPSEEEQQMLNQRVAEAVEILQEEELLEQQGA